MGDHLPMLESRKIAQNIDSRNVPAVRKKDGSRNYPADIATQRFLEESYNKEMEKRLHWFFNSMKNDDTAAKQSRQMDVFRRRIEANCPRPNDEILQLMEQQEKNQANKENIKGSAAQCVDGAVTLPPLSREQIQVDMKPVDHSQKKRLGLYSGTSREGKGRHRYLHSRYVQLPEQRYNFPVTTSWDYGWGLTEFGRKDDAFQPLHGRTRLVQETFYDRNGVPTLRQHFDARLF